MQRVIFNLKVTICLFFCFILSLLAVSLKQTERAKLFVKYELTSGDRSGFDLHVSLWRIWSSLSLFNVGETLSFNSKSNSCSHREQKQRRRTEQIRHNSYFTQVNIHFIHCVTLLCCIAIQSPGFHCLPGIGKRKNVSNNVCTHGYLCYYFALSTSSHLYLLNFRENCETELWFPSKKYGNDDSPFSRPIIQRAFYSKSSQQIKRCLIAMGQSRRTTGKAVIR